MIEAASIALSGLNAAQKRLDVSASNVANANTTGRSESGKPVSLPYRPYQVQQSALPSGGVQTTLREKNPATIVQVDPSNQQWVDAPNVDMEQEVMDQKMATYDFQANLKVLKAQDAMTRSVLNIIS